MDTQNILNWILYEITTEKTTIKNVMFRGRLRKLALRNNFNVLAENATDKENCVRFAVLHDTHAETIKDYVQNIIPDAIIEKVNAELTNPVLSKLKVNIESRYEL